MTFSRTLTSLLFFCLLFVSVVKAQVTGVKYMLTYNSKSENLDCYIVITEGKAAELKHRVQFNSQISLVVPKGVIPRVVQTYMPINDNQTFDGTKPCNWNILSKILNPAVTPDKDYYSVIPELIPSSFYNKMKAGDKIKLFSIGINGDKSLLRAIRLFDNATDPSADVKSMAGADFTNSFTIGSLESIYKGNQSGE
ncbi:MAG: hypothetical protein IPO92_09815 [Saprospiraceae bacterium]|nr:hypothetical protein [Saprospiraceae bacterium]